MSTSNSTNDLLDGRIKILDGLRGLAILLVIGFHYFDFFVFGWTGVDLFFVLSGFLITGKLVESLGSADYFGSFYIKRILRIVPLYFAMLLLFFVLIPFALPSFASASFKQLLQEQIYYWTFVVNIYDGIAGWPSNVTLIHFWSLACEMQFYLVWPFMIFFLHEKGNSLIVLLIVFCTMSLLFRVVGDAFLPLSEVYRYVLLPARLDAFSAGALLYLLLRRPGITNHKRKFLLTALVTLIVILLLMITNQIAWHYNDHLTRTFGYTLDAIFWASLCGYLLIGGGDILQRIFSSRILTGPGKYSYGMYIFHWPVYIIISGRNIFNAHSQDKTWLLAVVAFAATCFCSFISYHLLEKHFLKLKASR